MEFISIDVTALSSGFLLGLGLIMAIGAQNAFILRQGIKQQYMLPIVLISACSDVILILIGVYGLELIQQFLPNLAQIIRYIGAGFLIFYGFTSLKNAWEHNRKLDANDDANAQKTLSLRAAILITFAITWLNPHVYLDTMFLIGSASFSFPEHKSSFALGACLASFFFFFSLGYGSRLLSPLLNKPKAWIWIDSGIGIMMFLFALALLWYTP